MPLRIVLADDHVVVREGFRALLEQEGMDVVGQAGDGREAVRLVEQHHPDVVVLDLFMPLLNGLDAAVDIFRARPGIAAVLVTMSPQPHHIRAARRAGIAGYVTKTDTGEELLTAIRKVSSGETYISRGALAAAGEPLRAGDLPADRLTRRERQVLQLIAEGKKTKEIAALLDFSVRTAESYRLEIMIKLNTHHTAGLVRYAVRCGLVQAVTAWCAFL